MIHLLSFADKWMSKSLDRLVRQADQMRFFDHLYAWRDDLSVISELCIKKISFWVKGLWLLGLETTSYI